MSETAEKVQHTPGPWNIGAWCSPGRALFSENARLFAGTRYLGFVQGYPNPNEAEQVSMPEADANARLIAAAPQLLEALEALLDITPFARDSMSADIHERARAAIRSAKGWL